MTDANRFKNRENGKKSCKNNLAKWILGEIKNNKIEQQL